MSYKLQVIVNHKYRIFIFIILFTVFCLPFTVSADIDTGENFDPNYIISDAEVLDYTSMTQGEIQEFLERKGSYLATYSTIDPDGNLMTAAEIIFDRATTNLVSPEFLLVLLQKEMSLIEDDSPKQSQLDWAAGYGCLDGAACNPRWQGFWKQVNSASLQFRDYMDNPQLYTYRPGGTYTFTNPYSATVQGDITVTPVNLATAALYNYTPHVYNGNYNFHKIWQRYFTRTYFDGSLLQAEGEAGVWLIQNNTKRPFMTKGALTSRFDENKIIIVGKTELDKYPAGDPIKFSNYSLLRSPRGTVFLLVDDERRGFASGEALRQIGINPAEIIDAGWEDINIYREGQPITATSTYPTGALLQDKTTGGVYWVDAGSKAPLWDAVFLKTKFKNKKIIAVSPQELAVYPTVEPVLFGDGELVKSPTTAAVYLISDGKKRPFLSGEVFEKLGYKWDNIITVSARVLYLYDEGEAISAVVSEE